MKPILHEDYPWLDWVFGLALLGGVGYWAANKYDVPIPFISDNTDILIARDSFPIYGLALSPEVQQDLDNKELSYAFTTVVDQEQRLDFTTAKHNFALTTLDKALEYGKGGIIVGPFDVTTGGDCAISTKEIGGSKKALSKQDPVVAYTGDSPSSYLWDLTTILAGISDNSANNIEVDDSSEAFELLQNGQADVAVMWQPHCSEAVNFSTLLSTQQLRGNVIDVLMVSKEFAEENPQVVQDYMDIYQASIFRKFRNNDFQAINNAIGGEVFSDMRVRVFNPIVTNDWLVGGNFVRAINDTEKITGNPNNTTFNPKFIKKAIEPHVQPYKGTLSDVQKRELQNLRKSPEAQPLRIDYNKFKKVETLQVGNIKNLADTLRDKYPLGSYVFKLVQSHPDRQIGNQHANFKVVTLHDNRVYNPIDLEILVGQQYSVLEIYQDIGDQ